MARICPKLLAVFRKGDMSLEQVMAFTLTDEKITGLGEGGWRQL